MTESCCPICHKPWSSYSPVDDRGLDRIPIGGYGCVRCKGPISHYPCPHCGLTGEQANAMFPMVISELKITMQ